MLLARVRKKYIYIPSCMHAKCKPYNEEFSRSNVQITTINILDLGLDRNTKLRVGFERATRSTRRLNEPLRHGVLYRNTLETHENIIVLV